MVKLLQIICAGKHLGTSAKAKTSQVIQKSCLRMIFLRIVYFWFSPGPGFPRYTLMRNYGSGAGQYTVI